MSFEDHLLHSRDSMALSLPREVHPLKMHPLVLTATAPNGSKFLLDMSDENDFSSSDEAPYENADLSHYEKDLEEPFARKVRPVAEERELTTPLPKHQRSRNSVGRGLLQGCDDVFLGALTGRECITRTKRIR